MEGAYQPRIRSSITRVHSACCAIMVAIGVMSCAETPMEKDIRAHTLVIATAGDADYLFPPLVTTTVGRVVSDQLFEPLADIGDSLNVIGDAGFIPRLADSWTWAADSLSIAFHLNRFARWHDGKPVRAEDVRFTYSLYESPALGAPTAPLLTNIDSVTIRDSLTPVFWFKRRTPEEFYEGAAQMAILPKHVYGAVPPTRVGASAIARHPIGSGRFAFVRWVRGSSIEITSNLAHYRAPARLGRVVWTISPDAPAAATRFITGAADLFPALRAEMLASATRVPSIRIIELPSFTYGFLAFNLRDPDNADLGHPLFRSRALRTALSMAVNRAALVRNVFDTLALTSVGPTVRALPTTDTTVTQLPYDPSAAKRILDSLGWHDSNGDGIRDRGGTPLAFTVIVPSSSKDRLHLAVLLQEQWRRIGVRVTVQSLEINTFVQQQNSHLFDAAIESWEMAPDPASIRASWGSAATRSSESTNYGGYASRVFDREIDSALAAHNIAEARARFRAAYQTIINDAPAIWLYEPRKLIGVNRRIHVSGLRPDAWWAHMADWYVLDQ